MRHVSSEKNQEYAVLHTDTNDVMLDSCLINMPTFIFKHWINKPITNTTILTMFSFMLHYTMFNIPNIYLLLNQSQISTQLCANFFFRG